MKQKPACCLLLCVLLVVAGCGDSSDGSPSEYGQVRSNLAHNERPVRWAPVAISDDDRVVHIGIGIPYCSGAPKPRISRVRARERDDSVVITAFVTPKKSSQGGGPCAGLELGFSEEVKLFEPLGERRLFDGSISPPQRRG